MLTRRLGRSQLEVGAIGLGCWAIGGPFTVGGGRTRSWGHVDDAESIRAIRRALDLGGTLFDTADAYGAGHSEEVLGEALAGRRHDVVIATKFGLQFDEHSRQFIGAMQQIDWNDVQAACDASLRRLRTDYIDIYQLHPGEYPPERAHEVRDLLDRLVETGKIRYHGWSYDYPDGIRTFAESPHCSTAQNMLNVLNDDPEYLATCEELDLAWLCNGPLAMGLLSGKFNAETQLSPEDFRTNNRWFRDGKPMPNWLEALDNLRDVLTSDGRTLAQGALGWILARSQVTLPIPGFKTVAQVEENLGTLQYGPLSPAQMQQTKEILEGLEP